MAKKKIENDMLEKRVEILEMELKELKTVDPDVVNKRLNLIEETLYSNKEVLTMKEVSHYLDMSQSLLYKLTCTGEIPHFKPRGKMVFFEKKELIDWIKKNRVNGSGEPNESSNQKLNDSGKNEENSEKEQH